MFEEYFLKNGARVILAPHDSLSATTLVMYPVGSRYEPEYLSGVSHYVEHLMFKGTQKRKNTFILTREIDRLGAEYNAFTGKEYTGYYIKASGNFLKTSMDILSDMLFHSKFDAKEMEREKGPVIEELKMYRDNPLMNIDNIFEELLYNGPLGRDIGGTDEHVRSYKRPDVLAYRDKYYDVGNTTIVVAGAIDEKTKDVIKTYFGAQKKKAKVSRSYKPFEFGTKKKEERLRVDYKETDQTQLMMGFPALAHGHKDEAVLSVMNTILGGSMSSRLFITVRERNGLAYMVKSGSQPFMDTGYMYIRAGLDPKNINKAVALIKKEIEKISTVAVAKRELADAKTHLRGAMALNFEDSSSQANWYAKEALFSKTIETPEEYLERIDKVTEKDIMRVAKHIFKMSEMRMAIIGNVKKEEVVFV